MGIHAWHWKGFSITVALPNRGAQRARTDAAPPSATPASEPGTLVFGEPTTVVAERRDPEGAVAFIRTAIERRRSVGPPVAPTSEGDAGVALAAAAASRGWYHTIELPFGVVTAGAYDHRPLARRYGVPDDLHGQRVLDVGCADGFWALEFERRGGDVTAVDIGSAADLDLPPAASRIVQNDGLEWQMGPEFAFAREVLGSRVEAVTASVYDLSPDEFGVFDFVHAGDLLLHLRDPILALQRIRSVTAGQALLSDCFDPALDRAGAGSHLTRYVGAWSSATWWSPALSTLVQMVADAGFSEVDVVTTYQLPYVGDAVGPWRVVLRARP
jgi:tRNA (mo5U34)-methyltransferase